MRIIRQATPETRQAIDKYIRQDLGVALEAANGSLWIKARPVGKGMHYRFEQALEDERILGWGKKHLSPDIEFALITNKGKNASDNDLLWSGNIAYLLNVGSKFDMSFFAQLSDRLMQQTLTLETGEVAQYNPYLNHSFTCDLTIHFWTI